MRILDKYLINRIASGYLFILAIFIGLYFLIDIFSNLSDMLKAKPELMTVVLYYLYSVPLIILRVSPFSLLISTLHVFGEMNRDGEVTSIRACGVSTLRMVIPAITIALLISFAVFFIQEKIVIYSQKKTEDMKSQFIKKPVTAEETNLAFTSGNMIFFAERFTLKDNLMQNVVIFEEDKNRDIVKKIICSTLKYENGTWTGTGVIEYELNENGNTVNTPLNFETKLIPLAEKPQDLLLKKSILAEFSSLKTLEKEIRRLKQINAKNLLAGLIINFHQKIAEPFSHLFLIIGVLPLAAEIKKRKVTLSSLGIGFIFGFVYYMVFSFSIALGKSGIILPIFGPWLGPLFFLSFGITGLILER